MCPYSIYLGRKGVPILVITLRPQYILISADVACGLQAQVHRARSEASPEAAYNDIEAIRLWKCGDGDKARD